MYALSLEKEVAVAFKEVPKVDAKELYYSEVKFVIQWVNDSIYGRFYGVERHRSNSFDQAIKFDSYEDAEQAIKDNMLEGVSIMKVYC